MAQYEEDINVGKVIKYIVLGVVILTGVIILFSSFYTITSGEEGVLLTWDKAELTPIGPGPHFKIPIAQGIVKFDMKTQKFGADATQNSLESASSSDLQVVKIQLALNYHLAPGMSTEMFTKVGQNYESVVIYPTVHEVVKAVTAKYTAADLVTNREQVRADMEALLKEKLQKYNIVIEQVSITNFDFSAEFNNAIEQKVTAEQDALKAKNKLEQIKFEAEQVTAAAEGQKNARIAQAEGEAKYVELVQQQLSKSPQYVEYIKWSKWNGILPGFYMSGGSSPNLLMQVPSITTPTTN